MVVVLVLGGAEVRRGEADWQAENSDVRTLAGASPSSSAPLPALDSPAFLPVLLVIGKTILDLALHRRECRKRG